jgi:hypothetical protein
MQLYFPTQFEGYVPSINHPYKTESISVRNKKKPTESVKKRESPRMVRVLLLLSKQQIEMRGCVGKVADEAVEIVYRGGVVE